MAEVIGLSHFVIAAIDTAILQTLKEEPVTMACYLLMDRDNLLHSWLCTTLSSLPGWQQRAVPLV